MEDLWMIEYERICEEFCSGQLDKNEAVGELRRIGFDTGEALDHLTEIEA
jgi:hypothetical protein